MKKNNKFRNSGGNSNAFSLNYKFDSVSPAGKCSGTALDLIKRYNDLAKEAHSYGNYVEMEVFRQYAEHYRKIVTEINERRGYRPENNTAASEKQENMVAENASAENTNPEPNVEEQAPQEVSAPVKKAKKSFKVIELKPQAEELPAETAPVEKPKRATRRKSGSEAAAI